MPPSHPNSSALMSSLLSAQSSNGAQDVDMEVPDSPPEATHANSSQASTTQANTSSRVNGEGGSSGGGNNNTKTNFGAPGSSWSTKKFNEEYEKAEMLMLDRQWENKYGDTLAPPKSH